MNILNVKDIQQCITIITKHVQCVELKKDFFPRPTVIIYLSNYVREIHFDTIDEAEKYYKEICDFLLAAGKT